MVKANRGLIKFIILSIITFGIYIPVYLCFISRDINKIASPYDGKKTMNYFFVLLLNIVTLFIADLVWFHRMSARVGNELRRRGIGYSFGAGTYWGWMWFGMLLFGLGPFIYIHKLSTAMNLLAENYNS